MYNVFEVSSEGHARFSAISRSYKYYLHQHKEPFLYDLSYYFRQKLDLNEMNKAAKLLTTFKDFESFSKTGSDVHHFLCV